MDRGQLLRRAGVDDDGGVEMIQFLAWLCRLRGGRHLRTLWARLRGAKRVDPTIKVPMPSRRTSPVPAPGYARDWERGGWRESDAAFEERSREVDDDE
jgi:hypothetical protein